MNICQGFNFTSFQEKRENKQIREALNWNQTSEIGVISTWIIICYIWSCFTVSVKKIRDGWKQYWCLGREKWFVVMSSSAASSSVSSSRLLLSLHLMMSWQVTPEEGGSAWHVRGLCWPASPGMFLFTS